MRPQSLKAAFAGSSSFKQKNLEALLFSSCGTYQERLSMFIFCFRFSANDQAEMIRRVLPHADP
jgi:hypothetical protein